MSEGIQYKVVKILELPTMRVEVADDDVVRAYFLDDSITTIEDLKQMFDVFSIYAIKEKSYCFIFSANKESNATFKGGIDSSVSLHTSSINKICVALVAKNLTQRMIANFIIRFLNTAVPIKLLSNMDDAESYCEEMKAKIPVQNLGT